jgi:hypothetical protein
MFVSNCKHIYNIPTGCFIIRRYGTTDLLGSASNADMLERASAFEFLRTYFSVRGALDAAAAGLTKATPPSASVLAAKEARCEVKCEAAFEELDSVGRHGMDGPGKVRREAFESWYRSVAGGAAGRA